MQEVEIYKVFLKWQILFKMGILYGKLSQLVIFGWNRCVILILRWQACYGATPATPAFAWETRARGGQLHYPNTADPPNALPKHQALGNGI